MNGLITKTSAMFLAVLCVVGVFTLLPVASAEKKDSGSNDWK